MKGIISILILTFLEILPFQAIATNVPINGSHTVAFSTSWTQDFRTSAAQEAQRYAAIHAIDQMIQHQPSAIRQLYHDRKPAILNDILALCTQANTTQSINKNGKELTITFSATIDEDLLKDLLQRKEAVQQTVQLDNMEIAVFFTARNAVSVQKQHETNVHTQNQVKDKQASNSGAITDENVSSNSSLVQNQTTTTDNATVVTADKVNYRLDAPAREEFGTALISRFSEKGFEEIIDGAMLEASEILDNAYGDGDVIPAKSWRAIISNLKESDPSIQYMIVGTLDFGTPRVDEQTNMWIVEATVSGKIYKLQGNLPRLVAALAPQTQKARAADQLQAKKRALSGITPLAADEILAKLKSKNIIKK